MADLTSLATWLEEFGPIVFAALLGALASAFLVRRLKKDTTIWPFARKRQAAPSPPLKNGWIVRFESPDINFDKALEAGQARALEHFSQMIGGLRVGHVEDLRRLGFFKSVEARIGLNVDVGSWEEIKADRLNTLIRIIDEILPHAGPGVKNLLEDLREMAVAAESQGCSIGFML